MDVYHPGCSWCGKFLLNWPTTDANITNRSGASFLASVRSLIAYYLSDEAASPDNPDRVLDQFLLQQWRPVEDMLVERGDLDTGILQIANF